MHMPTVKSIGPYPGLGAAMIIDQENEFATAIRQLLSRSDHRSETWSNSRVFCLGDSKRSNKSLSVYAWLQMEIDTSHGLTAG